MGSQNRITFLKDDFRKISVTLSIYVYKKKKKKKKKSSKIIIIIFISVLRYNANHLFAFITYIF